jgi:hypothetical protein
LESKEVLSNGKSIFSDGSGFGIEEINVGAKNTENGITLELPGKEMFRP